MLLTLHLHWHELSHDTLIHLNKPTKRLQANITHSWFNLERFILKKHAPSQTRRVVKWYDTNYQQPRGLTLRVTSLVLWGTTFHKHNGTSPLPRLGDWCHDRERSQELSFATLQRWPRIIGWTFTVNKGFEHDNTLRFLTWACGVLFYCSNHIKAWQSRGVNMWEPKGSRTWSWKYLH